MYLILRTALQHKHNPPLPSSPATFLSCPLLSSLFSRLLLSSPVLSFPPLLSFPHVCPKSNQNNCFPPVSIFSDIHYPSPAFPPSSIVTLHSSLPLSCCLCFCLCVGCQVHTNMLQSDGFTIPHTVALSSLLLLLLTVCLCGCVPHSSTQDIMYFPKLSYESRCKQAVNQSDN